MSRNIQFLRNSAPLATKAEALAKLNTVLGGQADGAPAIVSYGDATSGYAALFGFKYANGVQIFEGIKYTVPETGDPVVEVPEEVQKAISKAIDDIKGKDGDTGYNTLKGIEDALKDGVGLGANGDFVNPNTNNTYVSGSTVVAAIGNLDSALKGLKIKYTKKTETEGPKIQLIDVGGNKLGEEIDATDFIVDGMLQDVKLSDGKLVFTWNVDSNPSGTPKTTEVNLADYIKPYTAGEGIDIVNNVVSVKLAEGHNTLLSVSTSGLTLAEIPASAVTLSEVAEKDESGVVVLDGQKLTATTVQEGIQELFEKALSDGASSNAKINKIVDAVGLPTDTLNFIAPTASGEFNDVTSIMTMLTAIDAKWNVIDAGTYA